MRDAISWRHKQWREVLNQVEKTSYTLTSDIIKRSYIFGLDGNSLEELSSKL